MFLHLEQILISFASHMPLEIFSPLASFVEGAFPPIPSPAIMIVIGVMAKIQSYTTLGIIFLIILSSLGQTLGASVVYYVVDKAEDIIMGRFGKFIGITHEQVESLGARLSKNWWDYVVLIFLRALPIIPVSVISIGSGLLKINLKLFLISTFVGSLFRDTFYIYLGYIGTKLAVDFYKRAIITSGSLLQITVILVVVALLAFIYLRWKKK